MQDELQRTASHDVSMTDARPTEFLSVQTDFLDKRKPVSLFPPIRVFCLLLPGHDGKRPASVQVEGDVGKGRQAQVVEGRAGTQGIETEGREEVPGRHLSGIIVATQSSGQVQVLCLPEVGDGPGRLVLTAYGTV